MFERILLITLVIVFSIATFFNWLFLFPACMFSVTLCYLVFHSLTSPVKSQFKSLTDRLDSLESTVSRLSFKKLT